MPAINEMVVRMGEVHHRIDSAMAFNLSIRPELGDVYVQAPNGEGKTSSVIQPYMWMLDRNKKVSDRPFRSVVNVNGRKAEVPYVYAVDWVLDRPEDGALDKDCELLLVGYVVDNDIEEGARVEGTYFVIPHGREECRIDPEGFLRRVGLGAYSRNGGVYVPKSYDEIKKDLRAGGAFLVDFRESGSADIFAAKLEDDWGFPDIPALAALQWLVLSQEGGVEKLRDLYKGREGAFLREVLLPAITAAAFPEKERVELGKRLLDYSTIVAEKQNLVNDEKAVQRALEAASMAAGFIAAREDAADELIDAVRDGVVAERALKKEAAASWERRKEAAERRKEAEAERVEIRRRKLSYEVWSRKERLAEAEALLSDAEEGKKEAETKLRASREKVRRFDLFEAADAWEEARGRLEGIESLKAEKSESDEARELENISASIRRACETAIEEEEKRKADADVRAAEARERESVAMREEAEARESSFAAERRIGTYSAKRDAARKRAFDELRIVGRPELFPKDVSPDIAGISRMCAVLEKKSAAFEERERIAETAVEDAKRVLLVAERGRAAAAVVASDARAVLVKAEGDKKRLEAAFRGVEACGVSRPRDMSDIESLADDAERSRLEAAAKRDRAAASLREVRAEVAAFENGVGSLPAVIVSWLETRGIPYQTGQDFIKRIAESGRFVEDALAECPQLPFAVIVSSRDVDAVLAAAVSEGGKEWSRGMAFLLTEEEAVDFAAAAKVVGSRTFGLANKKYLADPIGYVADLRRRADEAAAEVDDFEHRISSLETRERALAALAAVAEGLDVPFEDFSAAFDAARRANESALAGVEVAEKEFAAAKDALSAAESERQFVGEERKRVYEAIKRVVTAREEAEAFVRFARLLGEAQEEKKAAEKVREGAASRRKKAEEDGREAVFAAAGARKEAGRWKDELAKGGYVKFDSSKHELVEGKFAGLKERYGMLFRKLDGDRREITEKLSSARAEADGRKYDFDRALSAYAEFGSLEDAEKAGRIDRIDRDDADAEEDGLNKALAEAVGGEKAARTYRDEAEEGLAVARRDFRDAFPGVEEAMVPREEIGDIDFLAQDGRVERALDEARREEETALSDREKMMAMISSVGQAVTAADRAAGGGIREKTETDWISSTFMPTFTLDEGGAAALVERIRLASGSFVAAGDDRGARRAIRRLVEECRSEDAAYSTEERFSSALGCIGLSDILAMSVRSWEFERAALGEKLETRDAKRRAAVEFTIDAVDSLVGAVSRLEKSGAAMIRMRNVSKTKKGSSPRRTDGFEPEVERWVDRQAAFLASLSIGRGGNPKVEEKLKDMTGAYSLLEFWAAYNGGKDLGFQLRVMSSKRLGPWEGWKDFCRHSGGETSATMYVLCGSLFSLLKARHLSPAAAKKARIPMFVDTPFQSISNPDLMEKVLDTLHAEGVQLICVSCEEEKDEVRERFPKRYRMFGESRGANVVLSSELVEEKTDLVNALWDESGVSDGQYRLSLLD